MIHFRCLGVAVLVVVALVSRPAAAQIRGSSSSLTHVVSVTVPARVKVKVSSIGMMSSRPVGSAVKAVEAPTVASALAVSVDANRAWVLSVSAPATGSAQGSKLLSSAGVDTTVYLQGAKTGAPAATGPVILTVSAP